MQFDRSCSLFTAWFIMSSFITVIFRPIFNLPVRGSTSPGTFYQQFGIGVFGCLALQTSTTGNITYEGNSYGASGLQYSSSI